MGLDMQAKLLRAIEERSVMRVGAHRAEPLDVRFVAATHRELAELVREGKFREDLFYRLNIIPINVPPLREHPADIKALAAYFLARASGSETRILSDNAIKQLVDYPWPGNVRELRNAIERVAMLVKTSTIEARDLAFLSVELTHPKTPFDMKILDSDLNTAIASLEQTMIQRALEACGGNRAEAARRLGIHRQLLTKNSKNSALHKGKLSRHHHALPQRLLTPNRAMSDC